MRSYGKAGTKVLKGCVTMRVLQGEPSSMGTQAAWDKLCQSLRNYFFVQSRGLVRAFIERRKDTNSHGDVRVYLHFPSYVELTLSSGLFFTYTSNTCSEMH